MEFDLHSNNFMLDKQTMPLDWSFATESLSEITEIVSTEDALVPLPDSITQVDCEVTNFGSLATSLTGDPSFVPNYCLPWYHTTEEIAPTGIISNDYLVHNFDIEILEALPLNSVLHNFNTEIPDALPLNSVPNFSDEAHTDKNVCLSETNISRHETVANTNEERVLMEKREIGRARLAHVGYNEIKRYFYMPINKAAKEMNVGLTILKKRCRELGIPRWPHRKMKSLRSLICNVEELGKNSAVGGKANELEKLKRLMEENPEMQLPEETKKLRQACFKASYKRRRGRLTYHYRPRLR